MPQEITVQVDGYDSIRVTRDNEDDTVNLIVDDTDVTDGRLELMLFDGERDRLVEALQSVDGEPDVPQVTPTRVGSVRVAESQAQAFVDAKVPMLIDYVKENAERIQRVVSPYEVKTIADSSGFAPPKFVTGWDHNAGGIRNFRLSRIKGIAPAPAEYRPAQ